MRYTVILLSSLLLWACGESGSHQQHNNAATPVTLSDSLYKAVMLGHDEGMAQMGKLTRYQNQLQQQADSLRKIKGADAQKVAIIDATIHDLKQAKEGMNHWMHEFDPDGAGTTEEQKQAFYTKEKEKVDTVAARIQNSIKRAEQVGEF